MSEKENILLIAPFEKGVVTEQITRTGDKGITGSSDSNDAPAAPKEQPKGQPKTNNNPPPKPKAKAKSPTSTFKMQKTEEPFEFSDIRMENIDQNINVVAATRGFFNKTSSQGMEFREDKLAALENELEAQAEKVMEEADLIFKVTEFREKYQEIVASYETGPFDNLQQHILKDLITAEGVTKEIKNKIEDIIRSRRIEIDPVGISDLSEKGWDYLGSVFGSFGAFAKDQLFEGQILNESGPSCLYSHPYVTVFALMSGVSSGLVTKGPAWSRVLGMVAAPITVPFKSAMLADKALSRTVDKIPFGIGRGTKTVRYGGYVGLMLAATAGATAMVYLPDDSKELNSLRSDLKEEMDTLIGKIPLEWLPDALTKIITETVVDEVKDASKGVIKLNPKKLQKRVNKNIANKQDDIFAAARKGASEFGQEKIDNLTSQMPLTRKEWTNAIGGEVWTALDKAGKVKESQKGHMDSMNCYLLTVGGAFALANLARGPLKSASFSTKFAIMNNWNKLTELVGKSYRTWRRGRSGILDLREGNDLALFLAIRAAVDNTTVNRVLGYVEISGNLSGRPTLVIKTTAKGAGPVANKNKIKFNLSHIKEEHRAKFKAFIKELEGPDGEKVQFIEIDMANANKQLKEEVSPIVFERTQSELSKEINQVYKTGTTITRIRRLASQIDSLRAKPSEVLNQHYKNTAAMMRRMMIKSGEQSVFLERLKEIEDKTERLRAALTNTNLSPNDVVEAVKNFQRKNPGTDPTWDLIKPELSAVMRADQALRKMPVFGKEISTKYDKLIRDIIELDAIEKQMITEFRMIDEMFELEKQMHKRFEGTDALMDVPPSFEKYISGEVGTGGKMREYSRKLLGNMTMLYNRFEDHLLNKSIFLKQSLDAAQIKALRRATEFAAEAVWVGKKLTKDTLSILKSINLRNLNQAFKEDPKLAAAITSAGVVSFYKFIDFLINYLSGAVNENVENISKNDKANFIKFLREFVQRTRRIRNTRNAKPWLKWLRKFKSTKETESKFDLLFKLFEDVNKQNQKDTVKENRIITMKKTDLRKLVSEVLNENTGMGYAKYPYHSEEYSEDEPDEDYMSEWKMLVDEVCGRKKKNVDGDPSTIEDTAVEVAKLFIKDSDLFREVLELAGSNKSVGREIMNQLKAAKDKTTIDKKLKV